MIIAWSGSLILAGKPSLWTKADFQRESLLKRVKDQDLHFNLCPWKRKSVWDLWMLSVIYFQGPQRGYRRLGNTVSCRLLRKSTSTGPNCLTAIRARWWAAGSIKVIQWSHMYLKLGYICGHKLRGWTGHMSPAPQGLVTARDHQ